MHPNEGSPGPVFICSVDNPELKLAVETYPPTGAVTLASIDSDWNTPHAQWVLHEIASGKYQIFLFSSSGHLCLQAAAPKIGLRSRSARSIPQIQRRCGR